MLCQNCGKNEANIKYTQIINSEKKEFALCEECAKKFGIGKDMNFEIPIDLGSFLGEFLGEYSSSNLLDNLIDNEELKCKSCGMTYEKFTKEGKFGCAHCYDAFKNEIDVILKNLQGPNIHVGRKGKELNVNVKYQSNENKNADKEDELEKLKKNLKEAIKEERYEDAAKIRDEIKSKEEK